MDWWSLGALLYEMLTGLPPWYSQNRQKMFAGITRGELSFPPFVGAAASSLIRALLTRDPDQRLGSSGGAAEVRAHAFFA